jgi:hypothetical protein
MLVASMTARLSILIETVEMFRSDLSRWSPRTTPTASESGVVCRVSGPKQYRRVSGGLLPL